MKIKLIYSLVFICLFATTGFGQIDNRHTKLEFEYKRGGLINRTGKGTVNYGFWKDDLARNVKLFIEPTGNGQRHRLRFKEGKNTLYLALNNLKLSDNGRKLAIKKNCITASGVAKYSGPFYEIRNAEDQIQIPFAVTGNGNGEIKVSFDVVKASSGDVDEWACDIGKNTIVFKFNASDFGQEITEEPTEEVAIPIRESSVYVNPESNIKREWRNIDRERQDELCAFYKQYERTSYGEKAREILKRFDDEAWKIAKRENTVPAYQRYRDASDNCLKRYDKDARRRIRSFEKNGDLDARWEQLKAGRDKEAVFDFFLEKGDYKGEVLTFYKNNFSSLDAEFRELKAKQSYVLTVLDTIFKPRYRDISLDEGLKINDELWLESGILQVEVLKKGSYKINIQDSIGRDTTFAFFGYTFDAEGLVTEEGYTIEIEGGVPPFEINLYDDESKELKFTKESVDRTIILEKDYLLQQDIYGSFQVAVKHAKDDLDNITLKAPLVLEKTTSINWLILFVWLICIALLAFSIWIYWKERNRRLSYIK